MRSLMDDSCLLASECFVAHVAKKVFLDAMNEYLKFIRKRNLPSEIPFSSVCPFMNGQSI